MEKDKKRKGVRMEDLIKFLFIITSFYNIIYLMVNGFLIVSLIRRMLT